MKVIVIFFGILFNVAIIIVTDDNKMSPVSLSIVFGPNVFRYIL